MENGNSAATGYYDNTYSPAYGENAAVPEFGYTGDPTLLLQDIIEDENDVYAEQIKELLPQKKYAHPLLVLALLVVCFPVGLVVMFAFTKWGAFPKTVITIFVITAVIAVYEVLVAKQVILLPSLFSVFG